MILKPNKIWMSKSQRGMCLLIITAALSALAISCSQRNSAEEKPDNRVKQKPIANKEKTAGKVERTPLSVDTYSVLAPGVLGNLAQSPELKALRKRGILKAAVKCDREKLCVKMKYGAAAGFEVELLRKIANDALGVKLNIVDEAAPDADVRLNLTCGPPQAPPQKAAPAGKYIAGPYYYSSSAGWLCYQVVKGGQPLADVLDRITEHFYRTGTFQQVFKNWFVPGAPDVERIR